jgi:hypothetical protein
VATVRDDGGMEATIDVADDPDPALAVVDTRIVHRQSCLDVHVGKALEADAALTDVPRILPRVELKRHDYIVDTI